jgi:two-component system, LuxR family, sensor histidine kinase DctS
VTRITRIVTGLRTFARESGDEALEIASVRHVIHETLDFCRERFRAHGVVLEVADIPVDLTIPCRPHQIGQILLNLLNNALAAVQGRPSPRVAVTVDCVSGDQEFLVLGVEDNGPGVPAEIRDRIFQPFFTTKPVGQGTGLGLSISRGIAESHGGTLNLESVPGLTRFYLRIPRVSPAGGEGSTGAGPQN